MSLGQRIALLRNRNGLSQQALANRLGVSQATVAKHEKNINAVTAEMLLKYADLFQVSADYLLCRTDHPALEVHVIPAPDGSPALVHQLKDSPPLTDIAQWIAQAEARLAELENKR